MSSTATNSLPNNIESSNSFWKKTSKEKKTPLDENKINQTKLEIYKNNQYEFVSTETRNILLCGRTRSGKSTTMGVLKDPCYVPRNTSIFSETQNPKFQSFAINNRYEKLVEKFTINIIDSPGLFEVRGKESSESERSNEMISQTIAKCLENEITNINGIILFSTFEAGINQQDILAMKIFLDMFGGCGVSVCLCITHADKHTEKWCESIKSELTQHKELAPLIEREKMPILFMGCVNYNDKVYTSADDLLDDWKSVYGWRKELLDWIFAANNRKNLTQMNISKKKIEEVAQMMDSIIENFKFFVACKDFTTSVTQERIILHKECIHYLSENSLFINFPELADKFVTVINCARKLKERTDMDQELKCSLLWPLKLRVDDIN